MGVIYLVAAIVAPAFAESPAQAKESGSEAMLHPALNIVGDRFSPASDDEVMAWLHDAHFFDSMEEFADGSTQVDSMAVLAERERFRPVADVPEPETRLVVHEYVRSLTEGEGTFPTSLLVAIAEEDPDGETWGSAMLEHLLRGDIRDGADMEHLRGAWLEEHRTRFSKEILEFTLLLPDGVEVLGTNERAGTLQLHVAHHDALTEVLQLPALEAIEPMPSVGDDVGYSMTVTGNAISGSELEDLLQTIPFYEDPTAGGYYGSEEIGLSEGGWVRRAHASFNTSGTDGTDRVENCSGSTLVCASNPSPAVGGSHVTGVTSVLASDLTRGQDPAFAPCSGTACRDRSGVARRAEVLVIQGSSDRKTEIILDRMLDVSTQSASSDSNDPNCTGGTSYVRTWNSLYEGGTAHFNSNGNNSNSNWADCTVAAPGTGVGVFTVAAYDVDGTESHEGIRPSSSRGGTSSQGNNRSINAITGPNRIALRAEEDASVTPQYRTGTFTATSAATPTISGSAALFRDWYLAERGTQINDPGILYANTEGNGRHNARTPRLILAPFPC